MDREPAAQIPLAGLPELLVRLFECGSREELRMAEDACPSPVSAYVSLMRRVVDSVEAFDHPHVFPAELASSRRIMSRQEARIAVLLSAGYSTRQVSRMLRLQPATVRRHTANIYEKLRVSSRRELRDVLDADER